MVVRKGWGFRIQFSGSDPRGGSQVVLDGEVAVPCDPQPAIAGSNSLLRSCLLGEAGR
jgi:hypothetical protein